MSRIQQLLWRLASERWRTAWVDNLGLPQGRLGRYVGAYLAKSNAETNAFAVDTLAVQDGETVLEFGHGPGAGLPLLLACGPAVTVIGVEPSSEMIAAARHRNRAAVHAGRVALHEASTRKLPLDANSVDVALGNNVLYFWRDPAVDLAELRRVLRPGGRLGLGFRPRASADADIAQRFHQAGHSLYEVDQVEAMLLAAGFEVPQVTVRDSGWAFAVSRLRDHVTAPPLQDVTDDDVQGHWLVVD